MTTRLNKYYYYLLEANTNTGTISNDDKILTVKVENIRANSSDE